jgi:hypothetical protein
MEHIKYAIVFVLEHFLHYSLKSDLPCPYVLFQKCELLNSKLHTSLHYLMVS